MRPALMPCLPAPPSNSIPASSCFPLVHAVVLGVHPTVHAAYQANKEAIGVSTTALYNKLDRAGKPGCRSPGARRSCAGRTSGQGLAASHPRWLPGYQITVLDSHHLSPTEHRLKEWWGTRAAPFPGQAVLDQQRMLMTDVVLRENGHAGAQLARAGAPRCQGRSTLDRGSQFLHPWA